MNLNVFQGEVNHKNDVSGRLIGLGENKMQKSICEWFCGMHSQSTNDGLDRRKFE